jgi:hypothetical protein
LRLVGLLGGDEGRFGTCGAQSAVAAAGIALYAGLPVGT